MKGRESGMPDEAWWASFFEPEGVLDRLCVDLPELGNIVEFGCGYGTFTLPASRRTRGIVTALDIDPEMVAIVERKASLADQKNIQAKLRDFLIDGTGLATATQAHAMIFNLLHIEEPHSLLSEAHRTLITDGMLSIMHWRSDIPTPLGPPLDIRPTPRHCEAWTRAAGFKHVHEISLETCCPYHFGLVARK